MSTDNVFVKLVIKDRGTIELKLNPEKAPITVANFLKYVEDGFYTDTLFHRVIPGFMAQGGGFDTEFKQKAVREEIRNEADNGLKNVKYSVAMARTSNPHSATAQFFINATDTNQFLDFKAPRGNDWGYCVFGEVVDGKAVLDAIMDAKTGRRGYHDNVPIEAIVIERAEIVQGPVAA